MRDVDISDAATLEALLTAEGFNGAALIKAAEGDAAKSALKANTARAVQLGVCGVPSFQVNHTGSIIWGQDRLDVLQDVIAGWRPSEPKL